MKIQLCDDGAYYVTEADVETLRRISPGLTRLVRDCDKTSPTHFVCPHCGQICPLQIRPLHNCQS